MRLPWGLAAVFGLALASSASAVMAPKLARPEHRRPSVLLPASSQPTIPATIATQAVRAYNGRHGGGGIGAAALGGAAGGRPPAGSVHQMARAFLTESLASLGIDPQQLEVVRETRGEGGHSHVLYRQIYQGLPVEFSRVKVHFDAAGKVLGLDSNFRPHLELDVRPTISASIAAYTVKQDAGQEPRTTAQLVVVLDPKSGQPRLAWKLTALTSGRWRYFVDAHSGELILRYDDNRYVYAGAEGVIHAMVYPLDQEHGVPVQVPMANETVYLPFPAGGGPARWTVTTSTGYFAFSGDAAAAGKITTSLQGPFVRVSNFTGATSHYDNGSGVWTNTTLSLNLPHPYANNAVVDAAVNVSPGIPNAAAVRPVFSNFNVGLVSGGALGEAADIVDDDQVQVLDSSGVQVAAYVGNRGTFIGAEVAGPAFDVQLRSNASGTQSGFDLFSAQYLALTSPGTNGVTGTPSDARNGSFDWGASSHNVTGLRAESAVFYQLNQMHDFFMNGPNAGGYATLTPVTAMVLTGPTIINAFYDPDFDDLFFGDSNGSSPNDNFTDDATVSHHEYTHYVVQKIFNIQNFGQAGAISEALADYFSASSLDTAGTRVSAIGRAVNEALGGAGPLRDLGCTVGAVTNPAVCKKLGSGTGLQDWESEIHDDSIFVSQALWDLREDRVVALGRKPAAVNGETCTDDIVFNALLFFPESFAELENAMLAAENAGIAACGGHTVAAANKIASAFAFHNIPVTGGTNDPYDTASRHNDGFETAVDISTLGVISGTIFPASDIDFFTFAAGPGPVTLELDLPPEGPFYSGYQMQVFDTKHTLLYQAAPPFDGINTNAGFCTQLDCTSSQNKVKLTFVNPAATQLFVEISGGASDIGGSNSGVNNTVPYALLSSYQRPGAVAGSIVTATLDKDLIKFSVDVTTWSRNQDYRFGYAQLRDQAQKILPGTTSPPQPWDAAATRYLTFQDQANALGNISGHVQIAPGFNARFPAIGTVFLEVFGYNVTNSTVSLGLSPALNLTTNVSDVHAWNNVFNPMSGQKTTVRYDLTGSGHLTMRLYSMGGALVATLFDGDVPAGKGSVDWMGRNNAGAVVASGIYLLHVQGPGVSKTQKIAVVK